MHNITYKEKNILHKNNTAYNNHFNTSNFLNVLSMGAGHKQ